jgi:hypothetical protein
MSDPQSELNPRVDDSLSDERVLQLLDLATEVLEGLDELGVNTRAELLALMDRLEQLVTDKS